VGESTGGSRKRRNSNRDSNSNNVRRATEKPSRSASPETDESLSPMHRLKSPVFSDGSDDDLEIYDDLMAEFQDVISPDLRHIQNPQFSQAILDHIMGWKNLYSTHRSKAMDRMAAKEDRLKELEQELDSLFSENADMRDELEMVHSRCDKLEGLLQRYQERQEDSGPGEPSHQYQTALKKLEEMQNLKESIEHQIDPTMIEPERAPHERKASAGALNLGELDDFEDSLAGSYTPLGDVTIDVDDILNRLSKFSEKSTDLPKRLESATTLFESYLDAFEDSMGDQDSGREALIQMQEVLSTLRDSHLLFDDDSLIFESRRKISLLSNRLADTSSKLKLKSTEIDDLYMRLEQTEDWNPLAEMIKNFGGKGGSTASLPGGSAAASTGALLFDDVSEQSSSYFAVINRLRRNLEESRNECSMMTKVLGQGMRNILESPDVPRKIKDLTKSITESIEESADKLHSVIQDSYESMQDAERYVHSDQKIIESLQSQLDSQRGTSSSNDFNVIEKLDSSLLLCENLMEVMDNIKSTETKRKSDQILFEQSAEHGLAEINNLTTTLQLMKQNSGAFSVNTNNDASAKELDETKKQNKNLVLSLKKSGQESDELRNALALKKEEVEKLRMLLATSDLDMEEEDSINANDPLDTNRIKDLTKIRLEFNQNVDRCKVRAGKTKADAQQVKELLREVQKRVTNADRYEKLEESLQMIEEILISLGLMHHEMECGEDLTHPDQSTIHELQSLCKELHQRYEVAMTVINGKPSVSTSKRRQNLEFSSKETAASVMKGIHSELEECRTNVSMVSDVMMKALLELGAHLSRADRDLQMSIVRQVNTCCEATKSAIEDINEEIDMVRTTLESRTNELEHLRNEVQSSPKRRDSFAMEFDEDDSSSVELPEDLIPSYNFPERSDQYRKVIEDLKNQLEEARGNCMFITDTLQGAMDLLSDGHTIQDVTDHTNEIEDLCIRISDTLDSMKQELESAGRLLVQNDHLLEQQTHQHEASALTSIKFQRKYEKLQDRYRMLETKLRSKEVSLKKDLKSTQAILNRRHSQVARLEQSMQLQMNALSKRNEERNKKISLTISGVQKMLVEVEAGVKPEDNKLISLLKEVDFELSKSSSQLTKSDKELASLRSNLSAAEEQVEELNMKVQMTQNDAEAKTNMLMNRFEEEKRVIDQKYQAIINQLAEDLEGTKGDTRDIQRSIHNTVENLEQELDDTRTRLHERDLQTEELRDFATQKEDRIIRLETMLIDIQGHATIDDDDEHLPQSKPIYNLIRAAFQRFSITVQNRLAESEFIDAWAFLGLPGDDDHAASIFKIVDRAGGGLIEYDEFIAAVLGSHNFQKQQSDSMPRIVGTVPEPIGPVDPVEGSQVQELRAQFNNLMHNATTSPRNRRSILKELEVRMIELEDQDADPQELEDCKNLMHDLEDNENDEELRREAEEFLRGEDDILDDFTGDRVLKQMAEIMDALKEAILKLDGPAIRDNVTQLDESFDVVTNVLVVQNGWIEELQNRLAIAQDAVQILQKRVQSQAIVQDELRIDRLDSGVSNLTIGLGDEFGASKHQDEERKASVNIFQDEDGGPVIRGVTPQRAGGPASGNLRQDVLRRQSHQLLQRQYEELVAANKHEQAERVLQQLETLKTVIQGAPAVVRGSGVDEEEMLKELEAKDSIISDLHHLLGLAKEMWRDDIEEVKENILVLEDVVRSSTEYLQTQTQGGPLQEGFDQFRDSLDSELNKLYEFVQRDRPFPEFLPVRSEESLRYDRDMWREKAMELAKRGLSAQEFGNLPDIPGSSGDFGAPEPDVADFAKQITTTLLQAGDHQEAAVTQLAQKIIDMKNNEKKWQHEAFRNQDEYSQLQKQLEDMKQEYITMKTRYETALAMSDVLQDCENPEEIRKHIETLVMDNQKLREDVNHLEDELDQMNNSVRRMQDGTEQALWKKIATLREQLQEARGEGANQASQILDAYIPKDAEEMTELENLKAMVQDIDSRQNEKLFEMEEQYENQTRIMEANIEELTQFIEELENDKESIAAALKQKILELDTKNEHLEEQLDALAVDFEDATLQLEQQTDESNLLRQELDRIRKQRDKDSLRQDLDRYEFRQERHDKDDQLNDQDGVIMQLQQQNFNFEAKIDMLETQVKRSNKLSKNSQEVLEAENQELQSQLEQAKKSKVELINQYAAEMSRLTGLTRQLQRQLSIKNNDTSVSQWVENWKQWMTH